MRIFIWNMLLIFVALFMLFSFGEPREKEDQLASGLLLTFDDRNMLNWEKQIPLFAKYDAHVTFFVDHFDELSPEQIHALKKLKNAGHAIGCHGLRHLKAAEYCRTYPVNRYIAEEIAPAVKIMEENGFPPSCFAYPNSNHDDMTDKALLEYFRHLRSGCGIAGSMESTENAFVSMGNIRGKGRLDGISFHPKYKTDELVIQAKRAVDRIKGKGELLVLYAHDIRNEAEEGPKNYITPEALEEILKYAAGKQIRLCSFDELP
ncbi:MAG: polysaccharide deacetylase family protein [Mangrovibacterium sp.]|nr:polysaccharide deacetylase family protein [Mangrovibacterium sp.]